MWLFLLVTLCLASEPAVRLPASEDPAEWQAAFDQANLKNWASSDPIAAVVAQPAGERWRVTVTDGNGVARQVFLPPPKTPQERVDFAWLAASLLRPIPQLTALQRPGVPTGDAPPTAAVRTPQPEPEPEVTPEVSERPPAPQLPPEPTAPKGVEEPENLETVIEVRPRVANAVRPRSSPTLWARATPVLRLHEDGTYAPGGSLAAGMGSSRFRWETEIGWSGPVVPPEATPWSVRSLDFWVGVGSRPREKVSLGLALGSARRVWVNGDERILQPRVPRVAFESGLRKPLGARTTLVPTLRLEQDLAPTSLVVAGVSTGQVSPTVIALRLHLEWEANSMDPSPAQGTPYP